MSLSSVFCAHEQPWQSREKSRRNEKKTRRNVIMPSSYKMNKQSLKKQKNGSVELLRFLFTSIIIFFHINLDLWDQKKIIAVIGDIPVTFFNHGNIGVEFFFLVSGYLIAAKAWNRRELPYTGEDTLQFLKGKLKGLLPAYIIALIGGIVTAIVSDKLSFGETIHRMLLSVYDIALLRISGIYIVQFVPGTWYISAMLIGGAILYSLQRRFKDTFSYLIAPVGAILLLGYLFRNYTDLNLINGKFKTVAPGLLRGLAEMSLGCVILVSVSPTSSKALSMFELAIIEQTACNP